MRVCFAAITAKQIEKSAIILIQRSAQALRSVETATHDVNRNIDLVPKGGAKYLRRANEHIKTIQKSGGHGLRLDALLQKVY